MEQEIQKNYVNNLKWEQVWKTSISENAISGIKYRSVNNLYLSHIVYKRGYKDNIWVTFNQMRKN